MKATNFICPKCKKVQKVGRLRAGYTCPNCHSTMIITRQEKSQGHKTYRKNFMFNAEDK